MSTIIYHNHHIIPRYRCKEIGIDPEFPENLIRLTEQEHAQAHYERWLRYQRKEDLWAAILLGKGVIEGLDQSGENSYWYGREKPPEMRAKISKTLKEKWKNGSFTRVLTKESRRLMGAGSKKEWTEESRKKASESQMGEKNSQYGKKRSPEHTAKIVASIKVTRERKLLEKMREAN